MKHTFQHGLLAAALRMLSRTNKCLRFFEICTNFFNFFVRPFLCIMRILFVIPLHWMLVVFVYVCCIWINTHACNSLRKNGFINVRASRSALVS